MSFVFNILDFVFQLSDHGFVAAFLILKLSDSLSLKSFLRILQVLNLVIELFDDILELYSFLWAFKFKTLA